MTEQNRARMGFWDRVLDFFGFGDEPDYPSQEGIPEYEPDTGDHGDFSWQIAGYLEAGESYSAGGYHNFDPDSPEARVEVESFRGWGFLPDSDYVVIKVTAAGGTYYTTLGGPFEDYEDLFDAIAEWWEQGS